MGIIATTPVDDRVITEFEDNDNTQLGKALGTGITAAAPEDDKLGVGITASAPGDDCVIDPTLMDHLCTRNYDGSSGAMESDGLLLLMKQLKERHDGDIWLNYVITDDDTKMKKCISHPAYRPRGEKNIGGNLPIDIPELNWYADSTH